LDPSLRGGWLRLLFKPSPFDDPTVKPFKIGATRSFADEPGAKGTMPIPLPPGVVSLRPLCLAGQAHRKGIAGSVYQCGQERTKEGRQEQQLEVTIPAPASRTEPFEKNIEINWRLDPTTHAVALYVYAKGAAEINLVAAQVE